MAESGCLRDGKFQTLETNNIVTNTIVQSGGAVTSTITDTTTSSTINGGKITLGSNGGSVMGDGHRLGVLEFKGTEDAAGTLSVGARIQAVCNDAWDGTNNDGILEFYTTNGITETAVLKLDNDQKATFSGDVDITGELNVTSVIASTNTTITDRLIELANGTTGNPGAAADSGIIIERGDDDNLFMGWDESANKFTMGTGTFTGATSTALTVTKGTLVVDIEGNVTGNVTGNCSGTALTVTQAAQTAITSVGTLTALQVDNININENTISSTAGTDLLITPLAGQQIVLDGAIVIDAGVVTGATSITSTAFAGDVTGDVTGNCSGTALTVTQAAQTAITSVGTLTALTVSGSFIQGEWGSLPPEKLVHSVDNGPFGTFSEAALATIDLGRCERLANYFSTRTSLTQAQSQSLFQSDGAVASDTSTIAEAAAGDEANGYATSLKPQFLTGNWSSAQDIGNASVLDDLGDNSQRLIIFGGNISSGTGAITFTLGGNDKFDDSQSVIYVSGNGNNVYTATAAAGSDDDSFDLTLTPQDGTVIKAGSFLYFENTAANLVTVKGFFNVSGGTLTAAIAD